MDGMFGSGGVMPPKRRMRGLPPTYGAPGYNMGGEDFEGAAGPPDGFPAGNFMPQGPVASPQQSAMYRLSQQMQQNNQNPPAPGSYTPAGSGPRAQSARSLAQRNMAGMAGMGQPPRNIPIANPNRGMQADGTYGGASQVSNPTYGNAGLGTVGVQQPSQYLAPGRRNPYYGNYVSGGRVQTGQMQNWVAGRWPGVPQAQQEEQFDPEAARARVADGSYKNRQIGMGYKAVPSMSKYIQDSKDQRAEKVANAKELRLNRMAQIAQSQQNAGFDPMSLMPYLAHPSMPGAPEWNHGIMGMASAIAGANSQGAQHRDTIAMRRQELDAQRAQRERDHELAKGKMQAQMDQMERDHELRKSQIELELAKLEQQRRIAAAQLGVDHPDADLSGINGPGAGGGASGAPGPAGPTQGGYTPPLRMLDHKELPGFLDATHGMSDDDLRRHMQNKGVTTGHLDRFIEANKSAPIFEWAQTKRDRTRQLQHAQRLRGLFGNAPAPPQPQPSAPYDAGDYEGGAYTF